MKTPLRVLVTGGPTRAYLDDFRFLTNYSTGELAHHLCDTLIDRGVKTALVSGPCETDFKKLRLAKWKRAETHGEMLKEVLALCRTFKPHVVIFSAAVLDFEPATRAKGKTSSKAEWTIELKPTKKIIDEVRKKFPDIQRIGFKLEAGKMNPKKALALADKKVRETDLWALCLNYRDDVGNGKHKALVYQPEGHTFAKNKRDIAKAIVGTLI